MLRICLRDDGGSAAKQLGSLAWRFEAHEFNGIAVGFVLGSKWVVLPGSLT